MRVRRNIKKSGGGPELIQNASAMLQSTLLSQVSSQAASAPNAGGTFCRRTRPWQHRSPDSGSGDPRETIYQDVIPGM
eukprot:8301390-Pyramimonas_sp.AAC.1